MNDLAYACKILLYRTFLILGCIGLLLRVKKYFDVNLYISIFIVSINFQIHCKIIEKY